LNNFVRIYVREAWSLSNESSASRFGVAGSFRK
jgi:hypothetical protein